MSPAGAAIRMSLERTILVLSCLPSLGQEEHRKLTEKYSYSVHIGHNGTTVNPGILRRTVFKNGHADLKLHE